MSKPKVLFLDIETAPNLGYVWGKYEQNVIHYVSEGYIIGFCAKFLGKKGFVHVYTPTSDDRDVALALWDMLDEADIIVAHNGDRFDIRKINRAFLKHGLGPPSPYQTVDTKKVLKRYFMMNSNSLDDAGKYLEIGEKLKHSGFDLWLRCMAGDTNALAEMLKYNKQDVLLLEKLYLRLLPWIKNHPNYNNFSEGQVCPKCGDNHFQARGTRLSGTRQYQRRVCTACYGWYKAPMKGGAKPTNSV